MPHWSSEKIYTDNDDLLNDLILEIDAAEKSIEMEVFTFEDGVFAQKLLKAFQRAIQRKVKVRIIADGWGSPFFWNKIGLELEKLGVQIRLYRSLPWRSHRHNYGEPESQFFKFWYRVRRINRGFHRKVTIIDRKVAWVSSLNVSDVHLKEVYGKNAWSDIGARLTGAALPALYTAFDKIFYRKRWKGRWGRFSLQAKSPLVLLNDSFFRRRRTTYIQKRRLKRARRRIWIQNPYFVPERTLLRALYHAARRNIEIKIIIPEKNDQPLVKLLSFALLEQLIQHGIRIYEYQPQFAHKKILIVDSIYTIGSTNFNHRSFLHDLEVEVLLTQPESKHQLENLFKDDLLSSVEITQSWFQQHPWWYRILGRFLFFLRYWS